MERLTDALTDVLAIQQVQQVQNGRSAAIVFRGTLLGDAEMLYPTIAERFKSLGYTPMLEHRNNSDFVIAVEGLIVGRRFSSPPWVHGLLLVVTIFSTMLSGAFYQNIRLESIIQEVFQQHHFSYLLKVIQTGAPFALTLLLILGVHEMGHYIAARRHGVDVTLPYFIPFPLNQILGTLGAVIFIKSPLTNRKALFDVGVSGPLAGFIVALVAFILSMSIKATNMPNIAFIQYFGSEKIGMPLLLQWIGGLYGHTGYPLQHFVAENPVALAAWFGMLLTLLNLLPIGQLDGGHVMYTLFGRFAWTIAIVAFGAMMFLSLSVPGLQFLFIYGMLALLTGLRHPPPNNDITPLDWPRRLIGYATIVIFVLIGTLRPFPL